jgi:hypothetical protein
VAVAAPMPVVPPVIRASHPTLLWNMVGLTASWELTAKLLLMSDTELLDDFTNGNFDMTRCTFSGEIQLIGTGRSRRRGLHEVENPDKHRYDRCQ